MPYRFVVSAVLVALSIGALFFISSFFESAAADRLDGMSEALDRGFEEDVTYLLEAARQLNEAQTFDRYIESRDIANLLSAVVAERDRRGLDGLLVTDGDGIVLTRGRAVQRRGDFIYHTTTWGRALSEGRDVSSVERGAAHPLDLLGAVPMERSGEHIGSIVAAYIVDDAYAERVKSRYLPLGAEVAFFIDEQGIIGHSFEDKNYGRILSFYFNEGNDILRDASTIYRVSLNGDDYYVRNSLINGSDGYVGSALVFAPAYSNAETAAYAAAATLCFVGFLLAAASVIPRKRWLILLVWVVGTGIVFLTAYYISREYVKDNTIRLSRPTFAIYNSTIELDPPVAAFNRQFEHRVGVRIVSGGEAINAVEVRLRFDPEIVRVVDIDFVRSFCDESLIIERTIDNDAGNVSIVCGLPNPGFSERTGIVADIVLQPLVNGNFTLAFEEDTRVLANDGLGTQVLRYATDGSYIVVDEVGQNGEVLENFLVFSPTHTNSERWYSSRTIAMTWTDRPGDEYRHIVTGTPDEPSFINAERTIGNKVTTTLSNDGVHYFHLERQAGDGRETAVQKVQIDTRPPDPPRVRVSNAQPHIGELVRFEFASGDELSGLQKNFYIKLDGGIFIPVGDTFSTAFFGPGHHIVTVRAFDTANNFSESSITIRVQSSFGAMLLGAFRF